MRLATAQKFRAHVVEGDRAVDLMALILCYCLELKDKPSESLPGYRTGTLLFRYRI